MKKIYLAVICILVSGNLLSDDDLTTLFLKSNKNSNSKNTKLDIGEVQTKIPVTVNGKDLYYLPDLTLEKSGSQIIGQSGSLKNGFLKNSDEKQFGKFNDLSVIKKSNLKASTKSLSGTDLVNKNSEESFVLFDKKKGKFEVTHGNILFELKPGENIDSVVKDYAVSLVSKIGKQYIVTPKQSSTFIDVYSQISKDERLEYVRLMMVPPLNKPR